MFYCEISKQLSKPGEKPVRLVIERREREYTREIDGETIVIGRGWEIVKEVNVTLKGLAMWCDQHPDDLELRALHTSLVRLEELRRQEELRKRSQPREAA